MQKLDYGAPTGLIWNKLNVKGMIVATYYLLKKKKWNKDNVTNLYNFKVSPTKY